MSRKLINQIDEDDSDLEDDDDDEGLDEEDDFYDESGDDDSNEEDTTAKQTAKKISFIKTTPGSPGHRGSLLGSHKTEDAEKRAKPTLTKQPNKSLRGDIAKLNQFNKGGLLPRLNQPDKTQDKPAEEKSIDRGQLRSAFKKSIVQGEDGKKRLNLLTPEEEKKRSERKARLGKLAKSAPEATTTEEKPKKRRTLKDLGTKSGTTSGGSKLTGKDKLRAMSQGLDADTTVKKKEKEPNPDDLVPSATTQVRLFVHYITVAGQTVACCGSPPVLGEWNHKSAAKMIHFKGGDTNWKLEFNLVSDICFEYKYVLLDESDNVIRWEPRANREIQLLGTKGFELEDEWGVEDVEAEITRNEEAKRIQFENELARLEEEARELKRQREEKKKQKEDRLRKVIDERKKLGISEEEAETKAAEEIKQQSAAERKRLLDMETSKMEEERKKKIEDQRKKEEERKQLMSLELQKMEEDRQKQREERRKRIEMLKKKREEEEKVRDEEAAKLEEGRKKRLEERKRKEDSMKEELERKRKLEEEERKRKLEEEHKKQEEERKRQEAEKKAEEEKKKKATEPGLIPLDQIEDEVERKREEMRRAREARRKQEEEEERQAEIERQKKDAERKARLAARKQARDRARQDEEDAKKKEEDEKRQQVALEEEKKRQKELAKKRLQEAKQKKKEEAKRILSLYEPSRVYKDTPMPYPLIFTDEDLYGVDGELLYEDLKDHFLNQGKLAVSSAINIIKKATEILKTEPNVLTLTSPVVVVGDIHGQFYDMILKLMDLAGPPDFTQYLFLGDYVDRGLFSTEVCLYLFALKIFYPKNIWLLRGNHECRSTTQHYNFKSEVLYKYNNETYDLLMEAFDALPLAATVDVKDIGRFFCVHAGIGPGLKTLQDIEKINRFQEIPEKGPLCDLLWSDPVDENLSVSESELGDYFLRKFQPNTTRGCSYIYGHNAVTTFLETNNLVSIVRGHEVQKYGYSEHMMNRTDIEHPLVITIFSAPNYCDKYENLGGFMKINESDYQFNQMTWTDHPFILPQYIDAFTFTLPFVAENVAKVLITVLHFCIDAIPPSGEDSKALEQLREKMSAKNKGVTKLMALLKAQRQQNEQTVQPLANKYEHNLTMFERAIREDQANELRPITDFRKLSKIKSSPALKQAQLGTRRPVVPQRQSTFHFSPKKLSSFDFV